MSISYFPIDITTSTPIDIDFGSPELILPANGDATFRRISLCGLDADTVTIWLGRDNTVTVEGGERMTGHDQWEERQAADKSAVYNGDVYAIHRQVGSTVRVFVEEGIEAV